jgi:predicted DNA-binding protein
MKETFVKTTNIGLGILSESTEYLDSMKAELETRLNELVKKGEAVDSETANLLREVVDQFLDRVDDLRNVSVNFIERVQKIVEKA